MPSRSNATAPQSPEAFLRCRSVTGSKRRESAAGSRGGCRGPRRLREPGGSGSSVRCRGARRLDGRHDRRHHHALEQVDRLAGAQLVGHAGQIAEQTAAAAGGWQAAASDGSRRGSGRCPPRDPARSAPRSAPHQGRAGPPRWRSATASAGSSADGVVRPAWSGRVGQAGRSAPAWSGETGLVRAGFVSAGSVSAGRGQAPASASRRQAEHPAWSGRAWSGRVWSAPGVVEAGCGQPGAVRPGVVSAGEVSVVGVTTRPTR